MRNIDKIRAMSAEKLAIWKNKPCPCCCQFNKNCNIACKGLIKWLEQEAKPIIPELQPGDIIHTKLNQYVAIDDVWAVCTMKREKICICEIEDDVISVYRFDSNGNYHEIWRAEE